jgi:hypothetical protein
MQSVECSKLKISLMRREDFSFFFTWKRKALFFFHLDSNPIESTLIHGYATRFLSLCLSAFYPFFYKYIFMETKGEPKREEESKIEFSDMDLNVVSQTGRMIHKDS